MKVASGQAGVVGTIEVWLQIPANLSSGRAKFAFLRSMATSNLLPVFRERNR
jgi:hypothetical protein